ncbi:MAG: group III truncated hemoglobin [Sphingobacteriales bacterium]|jgi:hemoglobin|nr:MAG: group III truncated hemoglobin [Sphingobacteriales bacterium]
MNIQYYKKDIQTLDDIKFFVDTFYDKIRQDDLLAVIFNNKINDKWQQHLEKMYCFWQTVLLDEHTYFGSPFVPHAKLPVDKIHFERWIEIFNTTIDDLFVGEKAERAKWQGNRMAEMFQYKIEHYRKNTSTPLL